MWKNSINVQFNNIVRKKNFAIAYFVLLFLVMSNFVRNMLRAEQLIYVTQMYDFTKLLSLSMWSPNGYFFMEYLPLLIIIPTVFAYTGDKKTGMATLMQSRMSNRVYLYGKLIAVFLAEFIVFVVPLIAELLIGSMCFSKYSLGDPSNFPFYQTIEIDNRYALGEVFLDNRIIYVVVMILAFGVIVGIIAAWNVAMTILINLKYRVFAFFPVYLLIYGMNFLERNLNLNFSLNYMRVLSMFDIGDKNYLVYMLILLALIVMMVISVEYRCKKEMML